MVLGGTISMSDDGGKGGGQSPPDTCNDGLDNDGDGYTDSQDLDCDPQNPNYSGEEDGNANQYQGNNEPQ